MKPCSYVCGSTVKMKTKIKGQLSVHEPRTRLNQSGQVCMMLGPDMNTFAKTQYEGEGGMCRRNITILVKQVHCQDLVVEGVSK